MIAALSASGGMDSTSLLLNLLANDHIVYAVSFDYGQKHSIEIQRLKNNIKYLQSKNLRVHHEIMDLSGMMRYFESSLTGSGDIPEGHYEQESMKKTVVPNRNAIFSSLMYGYALTLGLRTQKTIKLALGVHSGDHAIYPDCRPIFYEKLFDAFNVGNWDSHLVMKYLPYIDSDKYGILKDALVSCEKLDLDFDLIFRNTNTSYQPDHLGRSSGKTGADIERILAFYQLGKKDPVPYVDTWENVLQHALKVEKEYRKKNENMHSENRV